MSPATRVDLLLTIPNELLERFFTAAGKSATLPAHCPWTIGDQVQMHGFPGHRGNPADHEATGFIGWVAGYFGATVLTGITTTGEWWAEEWGSLHRAGLPVSLTRACNCCRTERLRIRNSRPVQLSLFDLVTP